MVDLNAGGWHSDQPPHAEQVAATLSFRGPNGYRCAGHRWSLRTWNGDVEVVVHKHKRSRNGVLVHRTRNLAGTDLAEHEGRLVTTPMRTIADLAEVLTRDQLEAVLEQAQLIGLLDVTPILKALPGRRGAGKLLRALQLHDEDRRIRSRFERRFRPWLERRFPEPRTNMPVLLDGEWFEVDFAWPQFMAGVETDTYASHGGVRRWERDKVKDAKLLLHGWTVPRITAHRWARDEAGVERDIAAALVKGGWGG